jgi:hypothetical protein
MSAAGVEMYVMDTGVNNSDINVAGRWDFSDGLGTVGGDDTDGHGTHIAALGTAIDDLDGIVGVASGVTTYSLKVFRDDGTAESAYVIKAIEFVMERKVANPSVPMVINMSLGSDIGTTEYIALDDAIAAATAAGITVVVSAGNAGVDASTFTPAHAVEAITVGAYGESNVFSSFSNYGSIVDILAPGENLVTVDPSLLSTISYITTTGTSPAAAMVAGAAAMYLADNPTATPAQVAAALAQNGRNNISGAPAGTTTTSAYVNGF